MASVTILAILLSIQDYMASIKKEIPRSETYCSNSEEESDPDGDAIPQLEPVPEDIIQTVGNEHREATQPTTISIDENSDKQAKSKGRNSKAKTGRKATANARKRASTFTTSLEPATKKLSTNVQQALPESSKVDEKIIAARMKEMVKFYSSFF